MDGRNNSIFNKKLLKTKKVKHKQDKIKTTLTAKHNELIRKMDEDEQCVPQLEAKVDELKTKLSRLDSRSYRSLSTEEIDEKFTLGQEIAELEIKIKEIPNKKTKYFLQNGQLIFDYNELDAGDSKSNSKTIRKISISDIFSKKKIIVDDSQNAIKSKADCLKKFLSNVDPNYVNVQETTINEENYCQKCQQFRVLKSNEAKMVCTKCGSDVTVIMESDKPSLKDPPPEARHYEYKRYNHFCDWLAKIQGKESSDIPDQIINIVWKEIKRERIDDLSDLEEEKIRGYLKKYGYDKYYNHVTQILFEINGVPPISLKPEQERQYKQLFLMIQEPYERHRPETRSNFSSYSHIIYKFSQLLGYTNIQKKMKLLKSKEKRYQLDMIWKKICKDLGGRKKGWVFIPT